MSGVSGLSGLSGPSSIFKGVVFSPLDINGLILWLRSNLITSLWQEDDGTVQVAENDDVVRRWDDQSGNDNNFNNTVSAALSPVYKTDIQNGLPVLRFDGSGDFLRQLVSQFANPTNLTIFMALQGNSQASTHVAFGHKDSGPRFLQIAYNANNVDIQWKISGSGDNEQIVSLPTDTNWKIVSTTLDVPGNSHNIRQNGIFGTPNTYDFGAESLLSNTDFIGTINTGGSEFNGDIAEILIYDTTLSSANIIIVENYLNNRWAIF